MMSSCLGKKRESSHVSKLFNSSTLDKFIKNMCHLDQSDTV